MVSACHPLGRRIGVVGAGGKSTLARAIARKYGLAFIEIDEIQHLPGWQRRPVEDVERIVTDRMKSSPSGWVTDHNHRFIMGLADSVIVLELPFRTIFWRNLKRSLRRAWTKELVCGGNTETFRQHFLSRDSAILEAWKRRKTYRRIGDIVAAAARPGADIYYIRTPRELRRFYERHGLSRNAPRTVNKSDCSRCQGAIDWVEPDC